MILLLIWLFLGTTFGQNKVLPIALQYLSKTLGTEVSASHIDISFFDEVQLNDFLAFDSEGDTLLYVEKLEADIGLFSFFNKKLKIDNLDLNGAKINLKEISNGNFNYSHIVDHFEKKDNEDDEEDENTESNPWLIDLERLVIQDTEFNLLSSGSKINASIPQLKGDFKNFSLTESMFHLNSLRTEGINLDYKAFNSVDSDNSPSEFPGLPFAFRIDDVSIKANSINYNNSDSPQDLSSFDPDHISLENILLEGKDFTWTDSISFDLNKLNAQTTNGFELVNFSSELVLSNQSTQLQNTQIKTSTSEIIFNGSASYNDFDELIHSFAKVNASIDIQKSIISKSDITYFISKSDISGLDFKYLEDIYLNGTLRLENGRLAVKNLLAKSGNKFVLEGGFSTSNISNIMASSLSYDISRFNTSQSYLEKLLPTLEMPKELNNIGQFAARIKGSYKNDNFVFSSFNVNTEIGTRMSGTGNISGLQSKNGLEVDFFFDDLKTNLNSILKDKSILPNEVQQFDDITYTGAVSGNLHNVKTKGFLSTSLGNLELDAQAKLNKDYSDGTYRGYVKMEDFDLGTMLSDTTLGLVNFEGNIDGTGFNIDDLNTSIDGKVESICYDGYIYQDIELDGLFSEKKFDGKIISKDENLNFDIDGKIDLSGSSSTLDFTMDMRNIDLKELGFVDSMMVFGGVFKGKVSGNSVDDVLGGGTISKFSIQTQKGVYNTDSIITVKADQLNETAKVFSIDSPFLDAEIKGKIKPSTLVRFIKNYIKAYIPLEIGYDENIEDNLDKYFDENEDQNFIFSAKTKDINPILIPFLGNDIALKSASLGAYFSSQETRLDIKGKIDSLLYKGILFQRGSYFFDGRKAFINGNVNIEDISLDNEVLVPLTTINTTLDNKVADFNIVMENEDYVERLNLSGDLTRTDEYIVTFKDSILLNGFDWQFSPYNQVIFGDYGFYMQDLKLSKEDQAITVYTDENENGEAIEILFDDFILTELTAIIDKENEYFEGKIDGALVINSLFSKPFITADLALKNVTIEGNEAGNLTIQAAQDLESNSVKSNIRLSGPQNDATLKIDYGILDQSTKGELDIGKLEMAIVDPYLTDIFINSEGYVNGLIKINGDLNNLDLAGTLRTHNIKTTPVFTNSRYEVLDTDISFTDREIDFGRVELKDKNSNSAFVTGKILHKNLRSSIVDLNVVTENFEFLNTTENENELFYGNVTIKGNATIYGPIDDIEIDGSVSAINNSKLSVSPLSIESEILNEDFIIYTGDPRVIPRDSLQLEIKNPSIALPFDVDIKLNVSDDSQFSMILNPITGDKLTCNGSANLALNLTKKGEMALYGTYTVSEGVYEFSYGIISKEFKIEPNSTVSFNGDPLEGILNVDAVYVANTAVYDLIQQEESTLDENEIAEAQRKRDMNVILSLTKSIMKPEIKLDIQTTDESSISEILDPKLNQLRDDQDEMNNQVFGLLLFNNFILSKNAETDLAETGKDIAISSLSGLVSSQLNKLTDGIVKGLDLNFDLNSYSADYLDKGEGGVVTELGLEIEQSLFDNRLTISAGTNINLESSSSSSDLNAIAGDFILNYKLNNDGSYRLKIFRKSSFDRYIDENSTKNGASFFVRKEFGEVKKRKINN